MPVISQQMLESAAIAIQDYMVKFVSKSQILNKLSCPAGSESAKIQTVLTNIVFTTGQAEEDPEKSKTLDFLDKTNPEKLQLVHSLKTIVAGIAAEDVKLQLQQGSVDTIQEYIKHIANVLFYNALAITT